MTAPQECPGAQCVSFLKGTQNSGNSRTWHDPDRCYSGPNQRDRRYSGRASRKRDRRELSCLIRPLLEVDLSRYRRGGLVAGGPIPAVARLWFAAVSPSRYAEGAELRANPGQPVEAANPDGSTTSGNGHHHPLRQPITSECPVSFPAGPLLPRQPEDLLQVRRMRSGPAVPSPKLRWDVTMSSVCSTGVSVQSDLCIIGGADREAFSFVIPRSSFRHLNKKKWICIQPSV